MYTRKKFLKLAGASAILTVMTSGQSWSKSNLKEESRRSKRIASIIEEYDHQGIHRTGTRTDTQNAYWLANQIKSLELQPILKDFTFDRLDVQVAEVQVGERKIEGIPLFDGTYTDQKETTGRLGFLSGDAEIGIVQLPPFYYGEQGKTFMEARKGNQYRGLIAVSDGTVWKIPPGLTLLNADSYTKPFGPPVLQVSSQAWSYLKVAAETGEMAKLTISVKKTPAEILNVVVQIKGKDSTLPPVVVVTPRSGWWHCASERGGGIACWLEMMRGILTSKPIRDVIFLATSGHELGHLGLNHFLDEHPELITSAKAWIHLGANFAASRFVDPSITIQASDILLEKLILEAMSQVSMAPDARLQYLNLDTK
jgi:hypothetical protein